MVCFGHLGRNFDRKSGSERFGRALLKRFELGDTVSSFRGLRIGYGAMQSTILIRPRMEAPFYR